jgi:rod shape-determining protein MreC
MALQRRTRGTRALVVTLITASLVTITVDYKEGSSGPLAEVGKAALSVIAPMQDGVSRAFRPVSHFFSSLAELPSIRDQRDQLRAQVAQLKQQLNESVPYQQKIQELEGLLNLRSTLLSDMQTTGANVIGSGVSNFEWSITIDTGSGDGVKTNDPVIAQYGLVGHVVQVTPTDAKVQLIIDPDSRVAARLDVSRETGLLTGRGTQDPSMGLIDASTNVQPNEGVETAGYQGGLFPPGIPIGTVASVTSTPGSLTKTVTVHPAVDFSTLDSVLVVLGPRSR